MKTAPKPILQIQFELDIEMEYDPFQGRTSAQVVSLIEDKLAEVIMEIDTNILGVFLSNNSVTILNEQLV
jgi:hypothetical protein